MFPAAMSTAPVLQFRPVIMFIPMFLVLWEDHNAMSQQFLHMLSVVILVCLVQLDLDGTACVGVVTQLSSWGLTAEMQDFVAEFPAAFWVKSGGQEHLALLNCLAECGHKNSILQQVWLLCSLLQLLSPSKVGTIMPCWLLCHLLLQLLH